MTLVGEMDNRGGVRIIGVGVEATQGFRKGMIVDLDRVIKSITQSIEKAEQMSGCHLQTAYLSISGLHLSSTINNGVVAITNKDREVTPEDVERVIQATQVMTLPHDKKIIHVHPRQFAVDGNDGIIEPAGMAGSRLEAEICLVMASATSLQNLLRCTQRADIQEEDIIPAAIASAEAVLLPAEKDLGCLLLDIGGGTTEFAIYDQGSLWYTSVLPVGGNLITSDIAIGLRTPVEVAENLKVQFGSCLPGLVTDSDLIQVPDILGREGKQISRKVLSTIIEPRIREIFALIKKELRQSAYRGLFPGGVVLTGGTSQLNGLLELATSEMNLPVRIGRPDQINCVSEATRGPAFATSAGLLIYGARQMSLQEAATTREGFFGGFTSKIKHFFQDFFD